MSQRKRDHHTTMNSKESSINKTDQRKVVTLFDKMVDEYDTIVDPWFSHLYDELSGIVERVARSKSNRSQLLALDVGSGTGFQTIFLQNEGYQTIGLDISGLLTKLAQQKSRKDCERGPPSFCLASASTIPFEDSVFDLVNCCGSTLSFVPDYTQAFSEICRVTKPGGTVLLEVENKWNFDAFWVPLSSLFRDFLGYENSFTEALELFRIPINQGLVIKWPFTFLDGSVDEMWLKLFTFSEVRDQLHKGGIEIQETIGLHIFTNLVPSTVLSDPASTRWVSTMKALSNIDNGVRRHAPFNKFGASLVVVGEKVA